MKTLREAYAEIDRLSAINADLLAALKEISVVLHSRRHLYGLPVPDAARIETVADAAIAKAESMTS